MTYMIFHFVLLNEGDNIDTFEILTHLKATSSVGVSGVTGELAVVAAPWWGLAAVAVEASEAEE